MARKETYVRQCLIFYANPYSIPDEETGEVNEGISTTYLNTLDLEPEISDDGCLGIPVNKQTFSTDLLPKFVCVPGIYDVTFEMRTVKGKPLLAPIDLNFLSKAAVSELAPDGKSSKDGK